MTTDLLNHYVIILSKTPDRELSPVTIQKHIEHLRKLDVDNKLVLCGPFTDHPSGLVIVKVKNKEEAIAIAESDPFVLDGVRNFEVRSWMIASAENNYLG